MRNDTCISGCNLGNASTLDYAVLLYYACYYCVVGVIARAGESSTPKAYEVHAQKFVTKGVVQGVCLVVLWGLWPIQKAHSKTLVTNFWACTSVEPLFY
jgi:hypothetical protein